MNLKMRIRGRGNNVPRAAMAWTHVTVLSPRCHVCLSGWRSRTCSQHIPDVPSSILALPTRPALTPESEGAEPHVEGEWVILAVLHFEKLRDAFRSVCLCSLCMLRATTPGHLRPVLLDPGSLPVGAGTCLHSQCKYSKIAM